MDIEFIKKTKNELEFKIIGDKYTVTGLLQKKLLDDKNVEIASYYVSHPDKDECIFNIKTIKTADAKEALDNAMSECKKEVSEFNKQVLALMSEISTSKKKAKKK